MQQSFRNYALMLKWQVLSNKPLFPVEMIVQVMIAAGLVIGISFFFPEITPNTAKFLTTGAPAVIFLMIGLVMVPQMIAMARKEGIFDYMWSLPVHRLTYIAADATVWVLVCLPGVLISLTLGALYHDFSFQISPLVVPAMLLISLTGVFIGYAIAYGAPKPEFASLISQIIVFAIFFFSPAIYPIEQMPGWLATIHRILPVSYMADLSRGTLTDLNVDLGMAFAVVGAWCLAAFALTYYLVTKRR
jgi:ABC-2 type transport system permease protein